MSETPHIDSTSIMITLDMLKRAVDGAARLGVGHVDACIATVTMAAGIVASVISHAVEEKIVPALVMPPGNELDAGAKLVAEMLVHDLRRLWPDIQMYDTEKPHPQDT